MDVINTLVQENRAFAEELEEQIVRGQLVENMLGNAQKVMTENTQEIHDLKRQLSLKEGVLHQAEIEISMMKRASLSCPTN
ncbi:hypothetical protein SKAU_G00390610 [Synaphobranchus kaupii]|uniref:Uncharacterized protein n=1 Tax=Synaphobranchus kaupii TaxID=118154 RepID=A0A9Q1EBE3_SYNKA|nr:hypothetical protein SKAU_G00390610 [Synaphobranchus kaupii]